MKLTTNLETFVKVNSNTKGISAYLISTAVTFALLYFLFDLIGPIAGIKSLYWSTAFTLALAVHEAGYLFQLARLRVPSYSIILPFYSKTVPLLGNKGRLRNRSKLQKCLIAFAGSVANLIAISGFMLGVVSGLVTQEVGLTLVAVQALVMLVSLTPGFGNGQQIIESLFGHPTDSLSSLYATFAIIWLMYIVAAMSPLEQTLWPIMTKIMIVILFGLNAWVAKEGGLRGVHRKPIDLQTKRWLFTLYWFGLLACITAIFSWIRLV